MAHGDDENHLREECESCNGKKERKFAWDRKGVFTRRFWGQKGGVKR
jgi:hypothetical protein